MNSNQLITNAEALRLFFNDDVYLTGDLTALENTAIQESTATPIPVAVEKVQTIKQPETVATLPKVEEPVAAYPTSFDFKYLGKNEKSILILVNDSQNPVSTPQGTELLRKLVLSINLKNADFALLNYSAYTNAKFEHLYSFFACKLVISFGVPPLTLGLGEQLRHQLHVVNDIKMIFTHNLHDLETDLSAKKALWGTLKNLS
ncbi:hypothetical protein [Pedobacter xixiisoli]|uniref:DNA polymerase III psi subunit n=1 Tax=Pedobacter xixiisoli TaxID=1476464 RepID=A0A286A029_9SPHI|nr:hypothetical protein [Pedobacter xixiisoli]SOD15245.1 hypothetical protein SAMN06297358_2226 [Pedobacter xixiisoli]